VGNRRYHAHSSERRNALFGRESNKNVQRYYEGKVLLQRRGKPRFTEYALFARLAIFVAPDFA